jgi:catechol 2,3-dioxygenase-like lactoylglutathione lyase family enzyme
MNSTALSTEGATETPPVRPGEMKLEVVTLPVSDVDRSKSFYESIGWRLDIDLVVSDDARTVQFTPPHSECSIHFGLGLTQAEPGSLDRLILAVEDIDAARSDLEGRGVEVTEVEVRKPPGFESQEGRSYFAQASFSDPDGNGWVLQEITSRIPGREWEEETA